MAQYLKFDPVKRDYVVTNGSPVQTDSILERAYYALSIPKNNWLFGALDQGSLLYTLSREKRSGSIEQLFASYARDAIQQQLIDTGYANAVGVSNIVTSPTGTSNQVGVQPTTTPVQSLLEFVPV